MNGNSNINNDQLNAAILKLFNPNTPNYSQTVCNK